MQPLFSIVIPTLNEEKYISRILTDLTKQKRQNFEVIVVDGSSTDKTQSVVRSYSQTLPLHLVELKKSNLPTQKNTGVANANGEYIIFIDADMSISSTFTYIAEKQITSKKGFVFMSYAVPIEKKQYPELTLALPFLHKLAEWSQMLKKPFSTGACMIWEKNVFLRIGGFDKVFGEDHHIIRKAAKWGIRVQLLYPLKARFSLRRMKKDGRLKLMSQFISAHIYLLFNEKIEQDHFDYELGGHVFEQRKGSSDKKRLSLDKVVSLLKSYFNKVLLEP